jgi:hypothetical protein
MMKSMLRMMISAGMLFVLAGVTNGCSSDEEPQEQVLCERYEVEQTEYCVYQQPITETGYDCPPDLPNGIPFEMGTVCGGESEIPAGHERPIRERMDGSNQPNDAGVDSGGDADALSCEERRRCDTGLAIVQNFEVSQPDGSAYCGPLTLQHWPVDDDQDVRTSTCECTDGELTVEGDLTPCNINLGGRENMTVVVEAEAPGYATFSTQVDVPCCNPSNSLVRVDFEAAE